MLLDQNAVSVQLNENELTSPLDRIAKMVESKYGKKFRQPLGGIEYKQIEGDGTFNYAQRKLIFDPDKKNFSYEQLAEHEAVHILERDDLDEGPVHDHIIHATFSDDERIRLFKMSTDETSLSVFKYFLGNDAVAPSGIEGVNADFLQIYETKLQEKFFQLDELNLKDQVLSMLAALDLHTLKTIYFSKVFANTDPKLVWDFEQKMKDVLVAHDLPSGTKLYQFADEARIATDVVQNFQTPLAV